jgi:Fe-S cluster assembly scaffold protein SufB
MQSRGIGKAEAEKVLARAKVQAVVSKINDEKVAERTENFMNEIFGDE